MLGYYFVPSRENNHNHNTDYVWASNTPWASMTEGISFGIMDANGYINSKAIDNPDIIFLGSSHLEAACYAGRKNVHSVE